MPTREINSGRRDGMRRRALGGILTVAAVVWATMPVLAAEVVETVDGSAYGVSASVNVLGVGMSVGPTPSVSIPPGGGDVSKTAASVSLANVLSTGVLNVSANSSNVGDGNGKIKAISEVHGLGVQLPIVGSILGSTLIRAECQADVNGPSGSTLLLGVNVLNHGAVVEIPAPNTTIKIAGIGTLWLNRQVTNSDGNLAVTGLSLELKVHGVAGGTINVAEAVCGASNGEAPPATTTTTQPTTTTTAPTTTTTQPSTTTTTQPPTTTTAPAAPTTTSPDGTGTTVPTPPDNTDNGDDGDDNGLDGDDPVCEPEEVAGLSITGGGGGQSGRPSSSMRQVALLLLGGLGVGGLAGYTANQSQLFSRASSRLRLWATN